MKKRFLILTLSLVMIASVCFAYTRDWNNASPIDHTLNKNWPSEIRKLRVDIEDRLDDIMDGFTAGDTVTRFNRVPHYVRGSDDTGVADTIITYGKDVSSKTELFTIDEDDNVIQITTAGKIKIAGGALTDAQILVGNGSGVATDVAVSGNISLANTGAMTFQISGEAAGDILYNNAGTWDTLAKGTAYQTLRMNSGATAQEYVSEQAIYNYGTSTSSSTQIRASAYKVAYGTTGSLGDNGQATITNLPFSSASSYVCGGNINTGTAGTDGAISCSRSSGSSMVLTHQNSTATSVMWWAMGS